MDNAIINNRFDQEMIDTETKAEYITYGELANRIGTMLFCEEMDKRYRNFIDKKYKHVQELSQEEIDFLINEYKWYIITQEAAEYLQRETDELVYYDQELNVYAWGIVFDNTDWKDAPSTV